MGSVPGAEADVGDANSNGAECAKEGRIIAFTILRQLLVREVTAGCLQLHRMSYLSMTHVTLSSIMWKSSLITLDLLFVFRFRCVMSSKALCAAMVLSQGRWGSLFPKANDCLPVVQRESISAKSHARGPCLVV